MPKTKQHKVTIPEAGGWPGIFVMDSCGVADISGGVRGSGGGNGGAKFVGLCRRINHQYLANVVFTGPFRRDSLTSR